LLLINDLGAFLLEFSLLLDQPPSILNQPALLLHQEALLVNQVSLADKQCMQFVVLWGGRAVGFAVGAGTLAATFFGGMLAALEDAPR